jgi:hypothetical protein
MAAQVGCAIYGVNKRPRHQLHVSTSVWPVSEGCIPARGRDRIINNRKKIMNCKKDRQTPSTTRDRYGVDELEEQKPATMQTDEKL